MSAVAQRSVEVVENVRIARDTYRIRLADPAMARAIRPGQFLMIRPTRPGATDPFFGRPFALYDTVVTGRRRARGDRRRLPRHRPGDGLAGRAAAGRLAGGLGAARQRLRRRRRASTGRSPSSPAGSARRRSWPSGAGGSGSGSTGTSAPSASRRVGDLLLRRPDRRSGRGRRGLPGRRDRRRAGDRRRLGRPSRASSPNCSRSGSTPATGRPEARRLRAAADAGGPGEDRRAGGDSLRRLAREPAWPAASAPASVASCRSGRPTARRPPPGLRRGADLPGSRRRSPGRAVSAAAIASSGSGRGAGRPARSPRSRRPRRAAR